MALKYKQQLNKFFTEDLMNHLIEVLIENKNSHLKDG
jgi:hypothetical protein